MELDKGLRLHVPRERINNDEMSHQSMITGALPKSKFMVQYRLLFEIYCFGEDEGHGVQREYFRP